MLDIVTGASPELKKTREHKSSMNVDKSAHNYQKAQSLKTNSPQRKTFKGKFQGIKGDKINFAQNNTQTNCPKLLSDTHLATSYTVINNNVNQFNES